MEIVLASTSRYRKAQLDRIGLAIRAVPPAVDEDELKAEGLPPQELAERLAWEKAAAVATELPEAIVIGGDQLAEIDGLVLGKPGTPERAVEQLRLLSGRTHTLITAIAVVCGPRIERHTDITRLTMRPLREDELERYVAFEQPLDCAGAYKLESRGIVLFERIESADHSAITGVPLIALVSILRDLGVRIP